ncbi:hypothetical protein [Desulforhopalus sp. IMCC35007]|nr:hypothetical protein [Desulforhopalus sp. IMCC35007]
MIGAKGLKKVGYRYLAVDYDNDGFIYDVSQNGPVLGLSWRLYNPK